MIVVQNSRQQNRRHVSARSASGPTGAFRAHGAQPPVSIYQDPVCGHVYQVRRDEREHYGLHQIHSLEIAAEGEIEQQGKGAPADGVQKRHSLPQNGGVDAERAQNRNARPRHDHERGTHDRNEVYGVQQRYVAALDVTGAECLRDNGIKAKHHPAAYDHDGVEPDAAQANGAHGLRADAADHHRIHEAHAHPAEFGQHDWASQPQHGPQFVISFWIQAERFRSTESNLPAGRSARRCAR